jgi:hemerythrin-like domain-containing protein
MTAMRASSPPAATAWPDGFEVLDACHRQTLAQLEALAALSARIQEGPPDVAMRASAARIVAFFSTTARQHHEDEERHVLPQMSTSADPEIAQAALRLQQDHDWLEEDWKELSPHVDAIACGQSWYDVDLLREGTQVFIELSRDHIALEESCIYPLARARLGERPRLEMDREMAARRARRAPAVRAPRAARVAPA